MADFDEHLKAANEMLADYTGEWKSHLVRSVARYGYYTEIWVELHDTRLQECPDCKAIRDHCEACTRLITNAKNRMDGAMWDGNLLQHPPPTDSPSDYRQWLLREKGDWISSQSRLALGMGLDPAQALSGPVIQWIDTELTRLDIENPEVGEPLDRIKWICSTQVYVHIIKELQSKGYIASPDMNGKEGEANITELFRRLSQAFIISGRDGSELEPDELQRRYNGRPLPVAKAARLTFPPANEVK